MEIRCIRGAPLKDYNAGLQKKAFFSISSLWWLWSWNTPEMNESRSHDGTFIFYRFEKFWSSKKLENSKVENFESKNFNKKKRKFSIENQWKSIFKIFEIFNFHWFSIGKFRVFFWNFYPRNFQLWDFLTFCSIKNF